MKKNLIIPCACVFTVITLLSSTCIKSKNCHTKANFVNNSPSDVYVVALSEGYPDTNAWRHSYIPNPANDAVNYIVKGNGQSSTPLSAGSEVDECYTDFMFKPESDTAMVYVFDAHVLDTTPWDTIRARNLYIRRYDLSYYDFENNNWTITYP